MVTSAVAGEGKTTSSTMLARQFAELGQRVLIIDADLRKPSLHKRFDLDNGKGLSDYLAAHDGEPLVAHVGDATGFSVITSGETPPNPAELLASDRFRDLLEAAREQYDQIIIDCPPLLGLADAPTIAGFADGILVVIEAAATRVGVARATLKRLASARARLIGTVLVKFDSRVTGYGYGYGYHYADHYYYYSHYGAYGGGSKPANGRRGGSVRG
jgi:capsular exopolysaccharide synthesis family protein